MVTDSLWCVWSVCMCLCVCVCVTCICGRGMWLRWESKIKFHLESQRKGENYNAATIAIWNKIGIIE